MTASASAFPPYWTQPDEQRAIAEWVGTLVSQASMRDDFVFLVLLDPNAPDALLRHVIATARFGLVTQALGRRAAFPADVLLTIATRLREAPWILRRDLAWTRGDLTPAVAAVLWAGCLAKAAHGVHANGVEPRPPVDRGLATDLGYAHHWLGWDGVLAPLMADPTRSRWRVFVGALLERALAGPPRERLTLTNDALAAILAGCPDAASREAVQLELVPTLRRPRRPRTAG